MDQVETRRGVLRAGGAGLLATLAAAPAPAAADTAAHTDQAGLADPLVPLWPGAIPGARGTVIRRRVEDQSKDPARPDRWIRGIDRPALVVRRAPRPNGAAVLLVPGGGYGFNSYDNEGVEQANWLNARGITAFILLYRLPGEGWENRHLVPLQDAQRAMRLIRARAADFGVDPRRIAVLGFSAGGHLAGSLATRFDERCYAPVDAADALSARPDLAGLVYPVVSMAPGYTHGSSRNNLLGAAPDAAREQAASVERRVGADTPPVLLVHAGDDATVPVANSILLYQAMLAAHRPAALHLFDEGGHGFGTRLSPAMPASQWPGLFHAWGVRHAVFSAAAAA